MSEKAIRLVEYLLRLASAQSKIVRDITTSESYKKIIWLSDLPELKECFTQAWGASGEYDSDVWIEIKKRAEPELPRIPTQCQEWIVESTLRNKNEIPELQTEITKQIENPNWHEESDEPKFLSQTERLEDHSEIQKAWERYLDKDWLPWTELHNEWESIHDVYSEFFAIHQEQLRLGEECELVMGLGYLKWQTPTEHRIRRHLIVANALLEFEAQSGKFTVQANSDGASLRPELDMLEEHRPTGSENIAKTGLDIAEDNPWDKDCVEGVLKALVNSIESNGVYESTLNKNNRVTEKPAIEYAPALILRKRSSKGLTDTLIKIKERIELGEDIPEEFADLAEIRSTNDNDNSETNHEEINNHFSGEVFFPKLSNEEQRDIVDKIQTASGVLVQGPPGTGKSHTIANLICHLLSTGQRILVTAKTPRALQVLEKLLPDQLRPLCINLLGSGLDERKTLDFSVGGILRKNDKWDERQTKKRLAELEQELRNLREEKTQVGRRLRDIRESETHSQSIAEGTYQGTAAKIAEAVNRDRNTYDWFLDKVSLNETCPISEHELQNVLIGLRQLTPEKRQELSLAWPDMLPSAAGVFTLFESEKHAAEKETSLTNEADQSTTNLLAQIDTKVITKLRALFVDFQKEHRRLSDSTYPWMHDALRNIISGNSSIWPELHRVTQNTIESIDPLVSVADENSINDLNELNAKTLLNDVRRLEEHLENRGKLGWGWFRPRLVKERIYVLRSIHINGQLCSTLKHFSILSKALQVRIEFDNVWRFWGDRCEIISGPYALQLAALKEQHNALGDVLSLKEMIKRCQEHIHQYSLLIEPAWAESSHLSQLIGACDLVRIKREKCFVTETILDIEAPLKAMATNNSTHSVVRQLLEAIGDRDIDAYKHAASIVSDLKNEYQHLQEFEKGLSEIRNTMPMLTNELAHTYEDSCWENRFENIDNAWQWAQARFWIEEYIQKEDAPALAKRAKQIEDKINEIIAELASLRAWSGCFSRLTMHHRQHMEAWQQSIKRVGKGTGKHAPRHRREAREHLDKCREAVPAWVMPLPRVWDTITPQPKMFDVIIIDEASQCGFEALPLFYLGKKILIVGDDKQISPEPVGVNPDKVAHPLMEEFLFDFDLKSSFHMESSLFDHGKLRYGTRRITLREHFRCMPEIIRFSNDLCYHDTPLDPLRQHGTDRLKPLKRVFVEGGYREGKGSKIINRPEAEAIVKTIEKLCKDDKYNQMTMGVIVLQGDAQAPLIEQQLLERIGAKEMENRQLVCGNPSSFQGDERDVIFLSMVTAIDEQSRIGALTKAAYERKFNVAASRAKDQMWLFHSVHREDLSSSCLRRKLLEFFEETQPQKIADIDKNDLEHRARQDNRAIIKPPKPFDSWFEVDVALELLRKGYHVTPQFEVKRKRIDLVVEGGRARLAVECDGDHWHGIDRWEEDDQRQRELERCGWEFFRVRESAFILDRTSALQGLWPILEARGIFPKSYIATDHSKIIIETENTTPLKPIETPENKTSIRTKITRKPDINNTLFEESFPASASSKHWTEKISSKEIQKAIIQALSVRPNRSCAIHSLTTLVLKHLKERTSGVPRKNFEQRVMRAVGILDKEGILRKYKATNERVQLLRLGSYN